MAFWPSDSTICLVNPKHCTSPQTHQFHHYAWRRHHTLLMILSSGSRKARRSWGKHECRKYQRILSLTLQQKYNLWEIFSSHTISQNRQQKLHRTCSKTPRWKFRSGQINAHLNPVEKWTWKVLFMPSRPKLLLGLVCTEAYRKQMQCPDESDWDLRKVCFTLYIFK